MKNHNIYFEIYGKKMKAKILAKDSWDAKEKIKNKIIFHKVELSKKDVFNDSMDVLDKINDLITKR